MLSIYSQVIMSHLNCTKFRFKKKGNAVHSLSNFASLTENRGDAVNFFTAIFGSIASWIGQILGWGRDVGEESLGMNIWGDCEERSIGKNLGKNLKLLFCSVTRRTCFPRILGVIALHRCLG